jgi:GMP synthase-like glutamine amidotransferase
MRKGRIVRSAKALFTTAYATAVPALVLQHGDWGPPGLLADWLEARGIGFEVHRTYVGAPTPAADGYDFIVSLGSDRNPRDLHDASVVAELALLERAVALDIPVLGLCFGGQALAAVLGAAVTPAEIPELGWHAIETDDPSLVPAGPWLQWHFDRFAVPEGAVEVARSPSGSQAFRLGRHLGVQFHPESTVEIVAEWAQLDAERLPALGIADALAHIAASPEERAAAARAAFTFFDGFLRTADLTLGSTVR